MHLGELAFHSYQLASSGARPKSTPCPRPKTEPLTPTFLETPSDFEVPKPGSLRFRLHRFAVQSYCKKVTGMDRPRAASVGAIAGAAAASSAHAAGVAGAASHAAGVASAASAACAAGSHLHDDQLALDRKRQRHDNHTAAGSGFDVSAIRDALGPMFLEFRSSFEHTHT
jgi:hypothetical protein